VDTDTCLGIVLYAERPGAAFVAEYAGEQLSREIYSRRLRSILVERLHYGGKACGVLR
jgi:hypothetical protein